MARSLRPRSHGVCAQCGERFTRYVSARAKPPQFCTMVCYGRSQRGTRPRNQESVFAPLAALIRHYEEELVRLREHAQTARIDDELRRLGILT
jgi:hypothetical protein